MSPVSLTARPLRRFMRTTTIRNTKERKNTYDRGLKLTKKIHI